MNYLILNQYLFAERHINDDFDIISITQNGFECDSTTTLNLTIDIDFYNAGSENCWIRIDPAHNEYWETEDYINNWFQIDESNFAGDGIYVIPISIEAKNTASQVMDILTIKFGSVTTPLFHNYDTYELKIVIDKPFDLLSDEEQLLMAEKFLPLILFDNGEQGGIPEEKFFPKGIDILINNSEIWNREEDNDSLAPATRENLAKYCEKTNYINFDIVEGDENGEQIILWYENNANNYNTQLYASFFEEDTYMILTYWFFYLYNNNEDFGDSGTQTNNHIGEWEGMNIVFEKENILEDFESSIPLSAATSSHMKSGKRRSWRDVLRIENHPLIFVCNGSHATYFKHGESPNEVPFNPGIDYHYGNYKWIIPKDIIETELNYITSNYNLTYTDTLRFGDLDSNTQVEIIPRINDIDENNLENFWHIFGGLWGQSQLLTRIETNSPSGPPYNESVWFDAVWPYFSDDDYNNGYKWFHPYLWHEDQFFDEASYLISDFHIDKKEGIEPFIVNFSNYASNNTISWEWDFENDGIIDSYIASPAFIYYQSGHYTVSLKVSDGVNEITKIKENCIHVLNLQADFTANPTNIDVDQNIFFTDLSVAEYTDIQSWFWDFENDGLYDSFIQNPVYSYDTIGIYDVKLKISNGTFIDSLIKYDYITVDSTPPPEPDDIVALEYFFDNDPGFGSGITILVSPDDSVTVQTVIDISSLSIGFHRLYVRAQDENGTWGIPQYHEFTVVEMLAIPQNVILISDDSSITIFWDDVQGANSYRIYSSVDPYSGFELDETGEFIGTTWTTSLINEKRFYYVTAHSDVP